LEWRRANGRLEGFEAMQTSKPIVAVGADHPLEDEILMADYFRKFLIFYHCAKGFDQRRAFPAIKLPLSSDGETYILGGSALETILSHTLDLTGRIAYLFLRWNRRFGRRTHIGMRCFIVLNSFKTNKTQHPHLSPSDTWKTLFQPLQANATSAEVAEARELASPSKSFQPSLTVAHKEILRLLKENPADTITIVAIGPLTNLALAAAEDPETFLKVKEVVVMGGAIDVEGNITPVAEFNTYADAVATARVFALTSPNPASTMPPPPAKMSTLPPYPSKLSRQLKLTLFPLDITTPHQLRQSSFDATLLPLIQGGSPLAEWTSAFVHKTYDKVQSLTRKQADPGYVFFKYILLPIIGIIVLTYSQIGDA
jgi:hypothetical protein